jgi:hypothetical protein
MKAQDIVKGLEVLRPGAGYSLIEDDYLTIEWSDLEGTAPTLKELEDAIAKIKVDEATKAESDATAKAALLNRLGITAEEAALLLG